MSSAASSVAPPRRNWEDWLATASGPASPTEEQQRDRTLARVRDAIRAADDIPSTVAIYVKGSYANNTNVRTDADVDVAVEWNNTIKVHIWGDTAGMTPAQLGYMPVSEPMTPLEFRLRVKRALLQAFGSAAVDTRPDKHIGVAASATTLDADVVPCFAHDRYDAPHEHHRGHQIYPKSGGTPIRNFPKQNYDNGVAKNTRTGRRYKEIVRCTKRIIDEVHAAGLIARDYPGYLTECLLYNAPDWCYAHPRRYDNLQAVFAHLWAGLDDQDEYLKWTEPSELLMLFRGRPDRSPANARNVIWQSWLWIGGPSA
jgi:hypothetical protein